MNSGIFSHYVIKICRKQLIDIICDFMIDLKEEYRTITTEYLVELHRSSNTDIMQTIKLVIYFSFKHI